MLKNMERSGQFQRLLFTQMGEPKQRLWIDYNVHEGRKSIFFFANTHWCTMVQTGSKKTKGFVSFCLLMYCEIKQLCV